MPVGLCGMGGRAPLGQPGLQENRTGVTAAGLQSLVPRPAGQELLDAAPEPGFVPWNVQHPLPAPSALLAPFSSQPWGWGRISPLSDISHLVPAGASPRTLTQPAPRRAGDPQPCCQRGRGRAAASPCIQKEPSGGPEPSCHLRGIPAAVAELGEGTGRAVKGACQHLEAGRARLWDGSRGWGALWTLVFACSAPPSAPRAEGKHRLTQTCPRAGSAPAGTEPGAEGHPHPGDHPPLAGPPRVPRGARVLRR